MGREGRERWAGRGESGGQGGARAVGREGIFARLPNSKISAPKARKALKVFLYKTAYSEYKSYSCVYNVQ